MTFPSSGFPADCLKICDINLRQKYYTKATIRESLRRADILKLNEDELDVITRLFGFKMAGDSFTGAFIGSSLKT